MINGLKKLFLLRIDSKCDYTLFYYNGGVNNNMIYQFDGKLAT